MDPLSSSSSQSDPLHQQFPYHDDEETSGLHLQLQTKEKTSDEHEGFIDDLIQGIEPLPSPSAAILHTTTNSGSNSNSSRPGAYALPGIFHLLGGGGGPATTSGYPNRHEQGLELPSIFHDESKDDDDEQKEEGKEESKYDTPTTIHDEILIHAEPIDETELEAIPTAEPIFSRAKRIWKMNLFLSLTVETLVAIILVLGILFGVLLRSTGHAKGVQNKAQNIGAIQIPSSQGGATLAPTTQMDLVLAKLNLPECTLEALQNHNNPQSKAYEWLASNQASLGTYPSWRLVQRYALTCSTICLGYILLCHSGRPLGQTRWLVGLANP